HIQEEGVAFFKAASDRGLEGIVAKEADSHYQQSRRGKSWLKIKTHLRQEAVIGGFTKPRGGRTRFGSLVLGVYDGDNLVYVGRCGSGFTEQSLVDIHSKLQPLIQSSCPFVKRPKTDTPATWVQPK